MNIEFLKGCFKKMSEFKTSDIRFCELWFNFFQILDIRYRQILDIVNFSIKGSFKYLSENAQFKRFDSKVLNFHRGKHYCFASQGKA